MNSTTILNQELKEIKETHAEFKKLVADGKLKEACELAETHFVRAEAKLEKFIF